MNTPIAYGEPAAFCLLRPFRVTELEKRIDGLVTLFQTQQQSGEGQGLPATGPSPSSEDPRLMPCTGLTIPGVTHPVSTDASPSINSAASVQDCQSMPTPEAAFASGSYHLLPGFLITAEKAEEYLSIYRTRLVPNFPFVPIEPEITARDLHNQKRFLFWCIMQAVVPQTASVQKAVDDWVRKHAAMHIIVNKEKKIELLQGLIVYIAWGDVHLQMGINANTLLQLAIGLVMDMTLYTLAGPVSWMPKTLLKDAWAVLGRSGKQFEAPKPTLEEQRAILGGYFVAVPAAIRRHSQVQYTPPIARCFKGIREADALSTDQNLLALVRMQHLGDRIRATFPSPDREEGEPLPLFREHFGAVLASLRKEVCALKTEEPAIKKENPMIWAHYRALMVRLYEPSIGMRGASPSEALSATEPCSRTESLWFCLQAIQSAQDALLAIPADTFAYLPFNTVADIAHTMMASHRLLLEDSASDWDVMLARQKLDLPGIARRLADRFEEADNVALIVGQKRRIFEDESSRWANYAYRARWVRQWYLNKVVGQPPQEQIAMTEQQQQQQQQQQAPSHPQMIAPDGIITDLNMSLFGGMAMDQSFWDIMMLDGPGQMPVDASVLLPDQPMLPAMQPS
ncbi:hypothetical protein CORC01_07856 [Colletotrichum orchidophilum]|uniref:Uncharacterized protein n=1 Tax=Colletotrichum orchidophilum TaxID=1209926 RepID=A0A1G4B616_9PEZI|nr:uncharacterized protein CORC01_07856 [Colletotrichum orchidophilum]OHE96889.1 hypothetical protein CORC01_07856 [Colletotrichum orchidophilum]